MSAAHKAELHPEEKVTMHKWGSTISRWGLITGIVFLALTAVLGIKAIYDVGGHKVPRFYYSFLVALAYFLSIALGGLFFTIIQHLVRARWSVVVRRLAELITQAFPVLGVLTFAFLLLPMILGSDSAYGHWVSAPETDHLVHAKAGWLNVPFFVIRIFGYFAVWYLLSRIFLGKSVEQDQSGDPAISDRLRVLSAPAIIVFALTLCFAAFDLLMSVNPHFFSTIFGVYYFAGAAMSIMATLAVVARILQKKGRLVHSITVEHYHDLGKLMFAFVFFWSYIAFSQFMLIWYANIPEETFWFQPRMFTSWKLVSIALLFLHCVVPFIFLLSRWTKRVLVRLMVFAVWMLVMHYVDMFWLIMPELTPQKLSVHIIDFTALIGVGGFFVAAIARAASKVNLIPVKDPALGDSLSFENF